MREKQNSSKLFFIVLGIFWCWKDSTLKIIVTSFTIRNKQWEDEKKVYKQNAINSITSKSLFQRREICWRRKKKFGSKVFFPPVLLYFSHDFFLVVCTGMQDKVDKEGKFVILGGEKNQQQEIILNWILNYFNSIFMLQFFVNVAGRRMLASDGMLKVSRCGFLFVRHPGVESFRDLSVLIIYSFMLSLKLEGITWLLLLGFEFSNVKRMTSIAMQCNVSFHLLCSWVDITFILNWTMFMTWKTFKWS